MLSDAVRAGDGAEPARHYRCYLLDASGHISNARDLEAEGDVAALRIAEDVLNEFGLPGNRGMGAHPARAADLKIL